MKRQADEQGMRPSGSVPLAAGLAVGALLTGGPLAYLLRRARRARPCNLVTANPLPSDGTTAPVVTAREAAEKSYRFHLDQARAELKRAEAAMGREDWGTVVMALSDGLHSAGLADAYRAAHSLEGGRDVADVTRGLLLVQERTAAVARGR